MQFPQRVISRPYQTEPHNVMKNPLPIAFILLAAVWCVAAASGRWIDRVRPAIDPAALDTLGSQLVWRVKWAAQSAAIERDPVRAAYQAGRRDAYADAAQAVAAVASGEKPWAAQEVRP